MGTGKRLAIGLFVGGGIGLVAGVVGQLVASAPSAKALALFTAGGLVVGLVGGALSAMGFDARDFR